MSEIQLQLSDADFSEMLIKYMARHPDVFRSCRQLTVVGDDFVLDDVYGNPIYKELVDTINNINATPILQDTLLRHIHTKIEDGVIKAHDVDDVITLFGFLYGTPIDDPGFFTGRLPEFLRNQRTKRALRKHKLNPNAGDLTVELNRIKFQIDTATASDKVQIIHPFRDLIFKSQTRLIGTNIQKLDEKIEGLQLGEYALLIGYSGGGKSAVGSNIVVACAEAMQNATYISCEDTLENMTMRFYSKAFKIPYMQLRKGEANIELEAKYAELDTHKKQNLANCLSLISVKGVSEITPDFLYTQMVQEYESTGFVPTTVMLDQMQFVTPNTAMRKAAGAWEMEKLVSAELDELSHKKIGNRNFVLWVQHQAKGKLKKRFTREDIDGFKGIIHKSDLAVGVGRDPNNGKEIDLFSIKVRHTADFGITLRANFQYMEISSDIVDTVDPSYQEQTMPPLPALAPSAFELPSNPMANHA